MYAQLLYAQNSVCANCVCTKLLSTKIETTYTDIADLINKNEYPQSGTNESTHVENVAIQRATDRFHISLLQELGAMRVILNHESGFCRALDKHAHYV